MKIKVDDISLPINDKYTINDNGFGISKRNKTNVTLLEGYTITLIRKKFSFRVKKTVEFYIIEKGDEKQTCFIVDDDNFDIHFDCDYFYDCVPTYCEYICDELKEIAMEDDEKLNQKAIEQKNKLLEYFEVIENE